MANNNIFAQFIRSEDDSPMNYEYNMLKKRWGHIKAVLLGEKIPPFEVEIQTSSRCNLSCFWCIGDNIQTMNEVTRLPNNITADNVSRITQSLIDYKKGDLGIDTVKFSGFIGEPLVNRQATLNAMKHLNGNGIKVGLFSNGILLADAEVQDTVVHNDYVHISLDAGTAETFAFSKSKANYDEGKKNFDLILKNINSLASLKRTRNTKMALNIGFMINQYNYKEIYDISKRVKEEGADSIRFKCDVAGKWKLSDEQIQVIDGQIKQAKNDLENNGFRAIQVHTDEEMKISARLDFQKCYSHHFWGTIGSDGNVYPCDFTTFPGAPHYGNAINKSFKDVWEGPLRHQIIGGVPAVCHKICSPFAIRINYFLNRIKTIVDEKGMEFVESQRNEVLKSL
jgi:MoaA/NifB/PqqE/SkfB family radical SAM enzyme